MRTLVASVGSIVTVCVLASCGTSTPAAPTATPDRLNGFGVIMESTVSAATSFGACLSGSAGASCFSAPRIHAGRVAASAATAPGTPINLVASSAGSSVTLTWSAPTSGDAVTAYIIEAGSSPGLANLANFSTGNTQTIFQASGIGAGAYYVRLRAANPYGTSAPSNEAILVVGGSPGAAPGAPSGLTNTVNAGGTVSFAWNAASGSPTSYSIEAGSQPGLANLANSDLGSAATTMTATGVGAGTYYVRVRAKNAFGISAPSNEVTLVVGGGTTPSIPPGVRAVIDGVPWTAVHTDAILDRFGFFVDGLASPFSISFIVNASLGTHQITPDGPDNAHLSPYPSMPGIVPSWQTRGAPPVGGGSGTVTIVAISPTSASGTFSFVLLPYIFTGARGTKVITGGTFNVPVRYFP